MTCYSCGETMLASRFFPSERHLSENAARVVRRRCIDCFTCASCGENKIEEQFQGEKDCVDCRKYRCRVCHIESKKDAFSQTQLHNFWSTRAALRCKSCCIYVTALLMCKLWCKSVRKTLISRFFLGKFGKSLLLKNFEEFGPWL